MAEILLDTRYWNKVFRQLPPSVVIAIKKIKGAGNDKLLPTEMCITLNHVTDNSVGYFLKEILAFNESKNPDYFVDQGFYAERPKLLRIKKNLLDTGISGDEFMRIEKAIIQVAIIENALPETALYGGVLVAKRAEKPNEVTSTQSHGFVYFIRNEDIYKIGITDNLLRRIKELKPDEILNSVRCCNYQELERKMHAHFKKRRIPQTEYFRLDAAEVEEAHSLMTDLADFKAC